MYSSNGKYLEMCTNCKHTFVEYLYSGYCHVFNQAQARASEAIASVLDFRRADDDKGQSRAV